MQFKQFGRKNKKIIVMIHPELERWEIFKLVISALIQKYRVVVPVLPGYDEERPKSTFSSVEQAAGDIEKWLTSNGFGAIECIYGCSLGGAIAAKILYGENIDVRYAVIDSASAPGQRSAPAAKMTAVKDWLTVKREREGLAGLSDETIKRSLYSVKNYTLPGRVCSTDASVRYWYCEGEKERRSADISFMKKAFPGIGIVENPGEKCTDFLKNDPEEFCRRLVGFIRVGGASDMRSPANALSGAVGTAKIQTGLYGASNEKSGVYGTASTQGAYGVSRTDASEGTISRKVQNNAGSGKRNQRSENNYTRKHKYRRTASAKGRKKQSLLKVFKNRKLMKRFLIPAGAFSLMFFYLECLLRLTNSSVPFFGIGLLRSLISCFAFGAVLWLITTIIPKKWISLIAAVAILFGVGFVTAAEICVKDYFGTYYQISYMLNMSGQVAGDFGSDMAQVVLAHLWVIPIAAAPCVVTLIFRKKLIPKTKAFRDFRLWITQGVLIVLLFSLNTAVCLAGDNSYYAANFSANSAIPQSGILNMMRLELKYSIFGMPSSSLGTDDIYINTGTADAASGSGTGSVIENFFGVLSEEEKSDDSASEDNAAVETPVEYGDNILNIDFNALMAAAANETQLSMDQYFSTQTPTKKNEYTGIFEGKNLIMITAEAFSYAVIDEERTPALYELANNGFVLNNYYQPDWTQSTTGGEFAHMTGIIPTWVNGGTAFTESVGKAMPFGLGWMFRAEGYSTKAYHNNTYTYYGRDLTHPNLGYDYIGIGNGLEIPSAETSWPKSDLEMLQATIGADIEAYVNEGKPFHTYYMSVSGHADYGWDENDMSAKNREYIESFNLGYSEPVLAYLASQQELEWAMEYLLETLEEAGIADDTVIVLTPDHYPYALTGEVDYYQELVGYDTNPNMTSYYKNSLIIWSGAIEEPIEVSSPCTAVDAVPTILNLFGLDYDSRLLSGRDVLSPDVEIGQVDSNMHAAVFAYVGAGRSWVTAAGSYESYTGEFIPAEGVVLEDPAGYAAAVSNVLENRAGYAKYIIQEDYYRHVFPNWSGGMKLTDALAASQ